MRRSDNKNRDDAMSQQGWRVIRFVALAITPSLLIERPRGTRYVEYWPSRK